MIKVEDSGEEMHFCGDKCIAAFYDTVTHPLVQKGPLPRPPGQ